ncbi:MAG: ImmA/IrrE family metallo-endopeptidase [Ruminococcaceae bacterium]|nr:ImmA/IrrE family metallo-endopeptidase [Oscillospiraceae bacterium]
MGLESDGIYVRFLSLPPGVNGATVTNSDGTLDIYINSQLGEEGRRRALEHELCHARGSHLWVARSVAVDEWLANRPEGVG